MLIEQYLPTYDVQELPRSTGPGASGNGVCRCSAPWTSTFVIMQALFARRELERLRAAS